MTQTFAFDRATRVTGTETGVFHGAIDEGWDINGNANGGYLLALGVRALRDASGRPDPITVTAHYLSPGLPGDVSIETEIVKSGRQLATVSGSMRSNTSGRELMRVLGTFGDVGAMSGGFSYQVGSPPDIPSYEECVQRTVDNADTGRVTTPLMNHLNVAVRPEDAGFRTEHRSGRASVEGWFSFVDGRPIDTLALMLVVDAFPPPVFNVDIPVGWVPTIELTAHVRGIPAAGPLRCRFHSEFVQNGFLQEDGEVWDADGQLVAQSRQLALVPRPE